MYAFIINGCLWHLEYVLPDNPILIRPDGVMALGVTDRQVKTVFISSALYGQLLDRVICHELVHCYVYSYGIDLSIEEEERMAEFIAIYGANIISLTKEMRTTVSHPVIL